MYVPDPFLTWLLKWTIRSLALSIAIGVVAGVLSIVFRVVGTMVETLHAALHEVLLFWISLVQVYQQTSSAGQLLLCLVWLCVLLWIIYRGGRFLYQSWRQAL